MMRSYLDLTEKKKPRYSKQQFSGEPVYSQYYRVQLPTRDAEIRQRNREELLKMTHAFLKSEGIQFNMQSLRVKQKSKSRLPAMLVSGILSTVIASVLMGLPTPYNVVSAIALCGPLSVCLYGLKR